MTSNKHIFQRSLEMDSGFSESWMTGDVVNRMTRDDQIDGRTDDVEVHGRVGLRPVPGQDNGYLTRRSKRGYSDSCSSDCDSDSETVTVSGKQKFQSLPNI